MHPCDFTYICYAPYKTSSNESGGWTPSACKWDSPLGHFGPPCWQPKAPGPGTCKEMWSQLSWEEGGRELARGWLGRARVAAGLTPCWLSTLGVTRDLVPSRLGS